MDEVKQAVDEAGADAATAGSGGVSPERVRRVLLVEDNFLLALTVASVIGASGHRVIGPVASARQAEEAARDEELDAAVFDLRVAGGTTASAMELLHERGVPYLIVSAYRPEEWLPAHLCAAPYLSKPVEAADLMRALRDLLGEDGAGCEKSR